MKYIKILLITFLIIILSGCELFGKTSPKVTIDYNCEGIEEYSCSTIDDKLNCIIIMPECKGYSFVGWYDAKASGNEVNLDADFKKNSTIYAIWEEDGSPTKDNKEETEVVVVEKSYKVTFNANGGKGNTPSTKKVKVDEMMPSIGNTSLTRSGYTFMGWYDNKEYTLGHQYYNEVNEPVMYFGVKKNIALYAGWKKEVVPEPETPVPTPEAPKNYTVTFNSNGGNGNVPTSITVHENDVMPSISNAKPTRSGYKFTGWYDNKDYTKGKMYYDELNQVTKYFDKKSNMTLYAGWSKDIVVMSYKLIFNANGGSGGQKDAVMVKKGESLPRITSTAPTRSGYTFLGWYDSKENGTLYYDVSGVSTLTYQKEENTTLYAHYKANTYSISFDLNGGYGSTPLRTSVAYGSLVPEITKSLPTRSGYTFVGWYDNSDYTKGKAYYSSKNERVLKYDKTSDVKLYAGWSKNAVSTYVVAFNSNGGAGGQTTSVSVANGSSMPAISKTAPTKAGYTFNGWYDSVSGGTKYYTKEGTSARNYDKTSGCTLYAQYTAITYNISYTLNGGTASNVTSATYDKVVTINNPSKTFTVNINANGSGATISSSSASSKQSFLGWTADSNLDIYYAKYGSTTSTNNTWSNRTNKVKDIYFKNLMSKSGTVNLTANWGSVDVTLPTITKSGYSCGYGTSSTGSIAYASGSKYKPSITTTSTTLYAVCTKTTYKVDFNANGGSGGQTASVYASYQENMPSISQVKPTKTNHTFMGYYDSTSGGTMYYTSDLKSAKKYDKNSGTTLYARWQSNEKLKIYYLALGRIDGFLIMGNGTKIFIDGGEEKHGQKCVEFLKELGITKLDAIIGSHMHDNHINAHTIIADNIQVGAAYYPDDPRTCKANKTCGDGVKKENINKMVNKLNEKNVPINILTPKMDVKIGNLTFDILGPLTLGTKVNDNSLNMILKYGNQKFYFSGDSGPAVFKAIYNKYDHNVFSNITIFKHPHHGQNEVPSDFITVMNPKYVVVPGNTKSKAGSEYKKLDTIVYLLGGALMDKKTVITGAGANLKGYLLAETDGTTITITDKVK